MAVNTEAASAINRQGSCPNPLSPFLLPWGEAAKEEGGVEAGELATVDRQMRPTP